MVWLMLLPRFSKKWSSYHLILTVKETCTYSSSLFEKYSPLFCQVKTRSARESSKPGPTISHHPMSETGHEVDFVGILSWLNACIGCATLRKDRVWYVQFSQPIFVQVGSACKGSKKMIWIKICWFCSRLMASGGRLWQAIVNWVGTFSWLHIY